MPKFAAGQVVATRGVVEKTEYDTRFGDFVALSLRRHLEGDWGNVCDDDRVANEEALKRGDRLLSVYEMEGLPKIWIITEADRSATTVLFPDEY